jgi:two-component system sensor histidine kinase/response regulator
MNGNAIRVLLIEDNPGDARLIQEMLAGPRGGAFELERVDCLSGGLDRVVARKPDVVLLDLGLPDAQGLEALRAMQGRAARVPVVVLTGLNDEEVAAQAVQEGAQDYLVKGQIDSSQLARAIRYAIGRKQIDEARVHAEESLRETLAELEGRNQELESFTYSVSHDLKEPLRTLESFSHFLLEDYAAQLDEQGKDYLARMGRAAARMKQMIEELLALSRLARRPEELVRVDVGQVVANITAAFQVALEEKGGRIEVEGGLPSVLGDRSRVEQIFGNLIANGMKFNRSEGPVVTVGANETDAGAATFFVRDNGIGIDPQYHDKIFGVFQRLHRREEYDGTGAGLAIVKRAAEALGGRVWLDSAPDAGATFFVSLPLWREVAVAA